MFQISQPDISSIVEISPRSQVSQPFFTLQPHNTNSLDFEIYANQWQQKEPVYETSRVLLFKGIPEDAPESEILTICQPFGLIKEVFFKKSKRYAFLQFERIEQAQKCYENFSKLPPLIRGQSLTVFYTGNDNLIKPDSTAQLTRFLLLTFNKSEPNIDSNLIMQLVGSYGRCIKAVIFQLKLTQAFVEMEDVLQAIRVRETLDGQAVFNYMSVRVFFTEEKAVFQQAKSHPQIQVPQSTASTLENLSFPPHAATSEKYYSNIWSDQPQTATSCVWPNNIGIKKFSSHPPQMSAYHDHVKSYSMNQETHFRAPKQHAHQTHQTMGSIPPVFHTKDQKSETILLLRNLPQGITAKMLFLLFGMYGNVLKVKIFFKNPENALVEFQTPEQAELAKSHLNNCPVFGTNIFVTNSKQGVFIDTSSLKKGEETQYMGDYTNSPEHRYKFSGSKNHLNIVPPSKVLHLSNLCEDKGEDFYKDLFRDYGIIHKFIFLKGAEKMALMEMSSVDDTVRILTIFHNLNISGKYLKVSFSKYQKIKDF